MTVTSSTLSADMSRLYGRPAKPFRFNRRTAFAIGVAAGFHALVGAYVVKSHFETSLMTFDDPHTIVVQQWQPPKPPPPPPPPPKPTETVVKDPPTPKYHEVATIASTEDITPLEVPIKEDPKPLETVATTLVAPDPKPTPSLPPPPSVIRNPSWLKKPTASQVSALYPERAAERNVEGGATLMCEVLADGGVSNCAVVEETPKGFKFGEAAIAMSRYFRINPRTVDGQVQTGAKVRIPIAFNLG